MRAWKPEMELLLLCSRTQMEPRHVARLGELCAGALHWEEVRRMALWHRVMPLLFWNLKAVSPEGVPAPLLQQLGADFQANQVRVLARARELLRLLSSLEAGGIQAIPIKGPALAEAVYGNIALRPAGDLDILVRPSEAAAAARLLRAEGYRVLVETGDAEEATEAQQAAIRRFCYDFNLVHAKQGYLVELHWSLAPPRSGFTATAEELALSARPHRMGGRQILLLKDEENLLYLCYHGGKHCWSRLEWLVGVAELLRRMPELDEEALWRQAQVRGAGLSLLLGISLVHQLLGIDPCPGLRRRAAANGTVSQLTLRVLGHIEAGQALVTMRDGLKFEYAMCGGLWARLGWGARLLWHPNPHDFKAVEWKESLHGLYYLSRPFRLLGKYVPRRAGRGGGAAPEA
jgi:hypothetical protein